ncbi:MAG: hypothetical protein IT383_14000 [Deltaproteobacteria bacterium]|nr:hypothetical protein [Deltaproteobacteria bacterium]
MPLVGPDPPAERERPPWRGVVVGALAAALFIVVLAFAAYATRDRAGPVRPRLLDAGQWEPPAALDAGAQDAGVSAPDAGEVPTAEPEPDGGPLGPEGPPVELAALVAVTQPLLQGCLQEALRFDPSWGGKVRVRVELRGRTVHARPPAGASPVFAQCLAQRGARLEGASATADAELLVQLDGLRATATIVDSRILE